MFSLSILLKVSVKIAFFSESVYINKKSKKKFEIHMLQGTKLFDFVQGNKTN